MDLEKIANEVIDKEKEEWFKLSEEERQLQIEKYNQELKELEKSIQEQLRQIDEMSSSCNDDFGLVSINENLKLNVDKRRRGFQLPPNYLGSPPITRQVFKSNNKYHFLNKK